MTTLLYSDPISEDETLLEFEKRYNEFIAMVNPDNGEITQHYSPIEEEIHAYIFTENIAESSVSEKMIMSVYRMVKVGELSKFVPIDRGDTTKEE